MLFAITSSGVPPGSPLQGGPARSSPSPVTAVVGMTSTPRRRAKLRSVYLKTRPCGLVHEVQGHDDGFSHIDKLAGEKKIPLQVRRRDYVEDHCRRRE